MLREAMEIAYDATDQRHMRRRGFRNILLSAAALICVLMIGLVAVVGTHPAAMPLCFHPAVTNAAQPAQGSGTGGQEVTTVCPSGDRQAPSAGDVMIVVGLGLLGGALAAAFAIRNVRGSSTPYDIPIALALLKVPSGSLTATAGILLLGGGFVPGLSSWTRSGRSLPTRWCSATPSSSPPGSSTTAPSRCSTACRARTPRPSSRCPPRSPRRRRPRRPRRPAPPRRPSIRPQRPEPPPRGVMAQVPLKLLDPTWCVSYFEGSGTSHLIFGLMPA
jgi:hypothetical protein